MCIGAPNVISIRSDLDVIAARMAARDLARKMGFSTVNQARIATATSELARNMLLHAGEGNVMIGRIDQEDRQGLLMVFEDHGPGITDLEFILAEPESASLIPSGSGLISTRRLVDELEIASEHGVGTRVVCRKWLSHY
ncbi:MAG: anti-sigma regulatory factor [Chloroflexaceae bacterium]|nr:anti-sigma regulatory factor [Chloroflexaceae bacterium]